MTNWHFPCLQKETFFGLLIWMSMISLCWSNKDSWFPCICGSCKLWLTAEACPPNLLRITLSSLQEPTWESYFCSEQLLTHPIRICQNHMYRSPIFHLLYGLLYFFVTLFFLCSDFSASIYARMIYFLIDMNSLKIFCSK